MACSHKSIKEIFGVEIDGNTNVGGGLIHIDPVMIDRLEENPFKLDIFSEADCSLRLKKYHKMARGSSKSNQKNSGLANDIFSNIYTSVFTSIVVKTLSIISCAYSSPSCQVNKTCC